MKANRSFAEATLSLAVLVAATAAHAEPFCEQLGTLAAEAVHLRDAGTPLAEARVTNTSVRANPRLARFWESAVSDAYRSRSMTAKDAREGAIFACVLLLENR